MIILILFFLKIQLSYSVEISELWNDQNRPYLILECLPQDKLCSATCANEGQCAIEQKVCKDCVGTSILMTNIFERMGIFYRNSGNKISTQEFAHFLQDHNFVTFTSRSIYNQTDSFDSPQTKARYQSLCPDQTEYPVVFFELKAKSSVLNAVKYVACQNEIYEMRTSPEIIFNESFLGLEI